MVETSDRLKSRELLLHAAIETFASEGFERATVKTIADKAGVNVSLVSYYFNGKEGLYLECLESFGRNLLETAERVLQPPKKAAEFELRLKLFMEEFLDAHLREPDFTLIIHRECGSNQSAPIKKIFREVFMKMFGTLVGFTRLAQKAGFVRSDADPMIACGLLMGGLVNAVRWDFALQDQFKQSISDPKYRKKLVEHAIQNFLKGVSP